MPSLRNIYTTGPYLHDGSIKVLGEVVKIMGEHQLGKSLTEAEISSIVVFLTSPN